MLKMILKPAECFGETAVILYKFTKISDCGLGCVSIVGNLEHVCYYFEPFGASITKCEGQAVRPFIFTGRIKMGGNELIVAFFALAFLAFCLTAVALYALSRDKDEVADNSVDALRNLHLGSMNRPKPDETAKNQSDEAPD
jgi:hypothetical protein